MARRVLDVFLSSTALDLEAHRKAVHERLIRSGIFHCVRQEDFGAQDANAIDYCRRAAQTVDLFVGLIGLRRGWEPDGDNARRSITEMEHDWAREAGRRRYIWVSPSNFRMPADQRDPDAQHDRQLEFRKRVMAGGERIVSQKGFDYDRPELLASEIVEHLLKQLVIGDLITQLRPELARQDGNPSEEQAPAIAAAVEKLASDKDVDLLALARDPQGVDVADLQAKLKARAEEHEAAGKRERKASAEYWRHIGALARLYSTTEARAAYARAAQLDPGDAEALLWIGWLAVKLGNLDEAEPAYQGVLSLEGTSATERQAYWARIGLGDISMQRGSLSQALEAYQGAQEQAERLAKADLGNPGWQYDLGISNERIGDALLNQGNLMPALASYQARHEIISRLTKSDTGNIGWQRDLSVSHNKIGDLLRDQHKLAEALDSYQAALTIRERLAVADPGNVGWQRDLSVSHDRIGDVLGDQSNLPAALKSYRTALAIRERLARADPDNAGWQHDLSVSHTKIGDVLLDQGNLPEALASYRADLAIAERLAEANPGHAGWQRDVAISYGQVAVVLARQNARDDALREFERGRTIIARLEAQSPDNAALSKDLAWFDGEIAKLR